MELPYADVTVGTAHLSFVPGVNTRQILNLRAFLAGRPRPMVLMGDFNTPGGIPGMVSGWLQELLGYQHFFLWIMLATIPSFLVVRWIPLRGDFGSRSDGP